MSFATLSVISVVALLGPLLALPRRWHLPVVLGELVAGIVLGRSGVGYLDSTDPTFAFMADIGFALVMFVAGSHVPIRDVALRRALPGGVVRAGTVGVVATGLGFALSHAFGTGHSALYAVLIASSSAALILPIVDSLGLGGPAVVRLLPQVAVADTACIVALPLAVDTSRAGHAALGAVAVIAAALVVFFVYRTIERSGWRRNVHQVSESRSFAIELRVSLAVLFALAAIAVRGGVSIMLAGFSLGLVAAAVGEPRRVAKQLFALAEGFLAPLFFVWLGASLNLAELGRRPSFIILGVALGAGAAIAHLVPRVISRQPVPLGLLASAQLGVPVAAATVGTQLHVLAPGEASALILGALVTITIAIVGGSLAVRRGLVAPPSGAPPTPDTGTATGDAATGTTGATASVSPSDP